MFEGMDEKSFLERFSDAESCLSYIADLKWATAYACRKCGHTNYCKGKTSFSRRCTRCKHEESATAHTMFHNCRLSLPEAFKILFTVCRNPGISSYELSRIHEVRQMTCWKFRKKIMECMEKHTVSPITFQPGKK